MISNFKNQFLALKVSFFISLLSILLSILLSAFLNRVITFYYISYIFAIYFLIAYLCSLVYKNGRIYFPILLLIIYLFFVTAPITLFLSSYKNLGIYIKNNLLFIPLFLYYTIKLKNIQSTIEFIKSIIYGGIFFSFYLIFEFINKLFQIFPVFNNLIFEYISKSKNDYLAVFADNDSFNIESAIRPLGLELNFTSGAFFLSSVFIILLFSGWRFFNNYKTVILFQVLLFVSIIISTSRQNLFILTLFIGVIFIQNIVGGIFSKLKLHSKDVRVSISVIIYSVLFVGVFVLSNEKVYTDFITGKSGGTSEILLEDLNSLSHKFIFFLENYPFNFFFGIGAYTPEEPGIYYKLQPVNELHFFLDTFYSLGLVGFFLFWIIFISSLNKLRKFLNSNKSKNFTNYDDLKASFFYITILFLGSNVHYSPVGLTSIYIIALVVFIPIQIANGINFRYFP